MTHTKVTSLFIESMEDTQMAVKKGGGRKKTLLKPQSTLVSSLELTLSQTGPSLILQQVEALCHQQPPLPQNCLILTLTSSAPVSSLGAQGQPHDSLILTLMSSAPVGPSEHRDTLQAHLQLSLSGVFQPLQLTTVSPHLFED